MTAPLTLYLIRHGEVFNPDHILYGRLPNYRLSEAGRGQASAAGNALADVGLHALYASPMQRAQETATLIATVHQPLLNVQTDERLNECLTPHQGKSQPELDALHWDIYTGNEPPYETAKDLRRRLLTFIADARKTHANGIIAAVTHGDIVVTAFMYAKGQDEDDIGRHRDNPNMGRLLDLGLPDQYPVTASLSKLVFETDSVDEVPQYEYIKPY